MNKKIMALVLVCALMLGVCSIADARGLGGDFGTAYVDGKTTDRVHLREGASQSSASLGLYFTGTPIYYEYFTEDHPWIWVVIGTASGYMMSEYVSMSSVTPKSPVGILKSTNGGKVNLRASSSTSSDVLFSVVTGSKVTILGETATKWSYVDYGGTKCYVMSEFLTASNTTSIGSTIQNPGAATPNDSSSVSSAVINNKSATNRLNLRTKPSTTSVSLGKYYSGVLVDILSVEKSGWCKVRIGNLTGYMLQSYLVPSGKANNVVPTIPTVLAPGTGMYLPIYESQSTSTRTIGNHVPSGSSVQLLGVAEDWYHVQYGGYTGFMQSKQLDPYGTYSFSAISLTGSSTNTSVGSTAYIDNHSNTNRLNLRTSASTSSISLGKYFSGVPVTVLGSVTRNNVAWNKVRIGNLEGYMQADYLTYSPTTANMPTVGVNYVSLKTGTVDLYQSQSMFSTILASYPVGKQVVILGVAEGWYHVNVDGLIGFIDAGDVDPYGEYAFNDQVK